MPEEPLQPAIAFAEFVIDTHHRRLVRDGQAVVLTAKAFDLLTFLASNNGRIVTKDEIIEAVWDDKFVEESNLVVQISNLRRALGETPNSPRFLVTVPGKGYKFAADIEQNGFLIETHRVSELTIEQHEEIVGQKRATTWKWVAAGSAGLIAVGLLVTFGAFRGGTSPPARGEQVKLAKITTSGKVTAASMSPDGTFAVYSQKEESGESLWIRQIETGSESRIVEPRPIEYVGMTVAPDGQYIYASVFSKNEIDPAIVRIPIIGGPGVQIPNVATGSSISISPDGKRFAFTSSENISNETHFGVANIDGSNKRTIIRAKHDIRYLTMFQSSPVAWAPDGSEIALAAHEKSEAGSPHAILMVNPENGSERYLTPQRWKNIEDIAWLDEDRLAFIATEENGPANQIWVFSRRSGQAKRVTNDLRSHNWLGVANGKLLTVQLTASSSLRIGEIDEPGRSIKFQEIFTASEYVDELDWDLNGGVVYASRTGGTSELWRMNADGSSPKQLTTNANVTFGITVSPVDGSLVFASRQNGKRGIWISDPSGGSLRSLSEGGDQAPDISRDGKVVFHRGIGFAEGIFLTSQDHPTPRLLRAKCYFPAISPDGKQAACYFMDIANDRKWNIALVSTETGDLIRTLTLPVPIYERQVRFHPDGRHLTQIYTSGQNLNLILLPLDGGEARIFEGLGKGSSNLAEWSPDGQRFLYPVITESQDAVLLSDL
ncbi:MAG: winged helix-turn-helix domain-containing protein [Pyrinomonadaceae bacterium]